MAARTDSVWAIDIGNNSLKALHLSDRGGVVEVIGFDNIPHGKILAGSAVKADERDELIALSLRRFIQQNDLGKDDIVISVPSQNSFARFVNLPPVEPKRIPEIVRFEADQQIPFDINDVQWDWQLMTESGPGKAGKNRVGIFAIKNDVVSSALEHFSRENVRVGYVQMAPMALYNYMLYDRPDLVRFDNQATVVLNIGAENTDLVVCTGSTVWQRCIPMGGNAFTKAIADAFKLNFEKAEKLKRTAPMSKYARQILQAMKPIFADLASEIQRSLGFYSSSNPNTKLVKVIALGGGTKMRGLLKYLSQSLQMPIEMPDTFKRLAISSDVSAAKFHESVCDFGVVYGLALQGLGLARIESNLLPRSIARSMAWAGKARYFTAAAALLLLVSILSFARTLFDRTSYAKHEEDRNRISRIINSADQARKKLKAQEDKAPASAAIMQKEFDLFKYRDVIPLLHETIISMLPNEENNPGQKELYRAFAKGDVKSVLKIQRKKRKQIFVTGMSVRFVDDVATAKFDEAGFQRGVRIRRKDESQYGGKATAYFDRERAVPSRVRPLWGYPAPYEKSEKVDTAEEKKKEFEEGPGFMVTIEGYSPYEKIGDLIDPIEVDNDRSKWGFITRLMHLDDIADGNSPFKLYKKGPQHFKLGKDPVDLSDPDMPIGIGLVKDVTTKKVERDDNRRYWTEPTGRSQSTEQLLIDPMTKETISKVVELDEEGNKKIDSRGKDVYKINDHWFRLNFKLIWKDAPKPKETEDTGYQLPNFQTMRR